jgi:hypothetical protein
MNLLGPIGRMKKTSLVVLKAEWSFPSFLWPADEETKREVEADEIQDLECLMRECKVLEANISQCCMQT